jgi:hypothetical protein
MPSVPITDIKLHHNDLIVSTQGRSMWIMDDITPLHSVGQQTATAAAVLFKPRERVRGRLGGGRGGFGGGGGGAAPGQAQFPRMARRSTTTSAALPRGAVTIEISDATGKVVRTFSSAASTVAAGDAPAAAAPDDEEGGGGFRRAAPPVRLQTNTGMNRLTWDFNSAAGFAVPPGSYKVKMTVGSWSDTQPLTLKIDPRLAADNVTTADLREQFEHNQRMRDMVAEVGTRGEPRATGANALQSGGSADSLAAVKELAVALFGADEGVRYRSAGTANADHLSRGHDDASGSADRSRRGRAVPNAAQGARRRRGQGQQDAWRRQVMV